MSSTPLNPQPMCARMALFTSATLGAAMRVSVANSPAWFMPISITAWRCCSRKLSSVSGKPMWLLKLPAVANTASAPWAARKMVASISFTVVLPLDPVMPYTNGLSCLRHAAASVCSAARVSSTLRQPENEAQSPRETTAVAPLANTSGTKSCASWFSPTRAKNRSPCWAVRLSVVIWLMWLSVAISGSLKRRRTKFWVNAVMVYSKILLMVVAKSFFG